MELQEIAANYRDQNAALVPIMLQRLAKMQLELSKPTRNQPCQQTAHDSPFKSFSCPPLPGVKSPPVKGACVIPERPFSHLNKESRMNSNSLANDVLGSAGLAVPSPCVNNQPDVKHHSHAHDSNSSGWLEMSKFVIGRYEMWPMTPELQQMFILRYLTPMGEYQELLSFAFEHRALKLILTYLDMDKNDNIRLCFDSLKYLASLLCHKKFAIEFMASSSLQTLLRIPRPSIGALGVSLCLYYLAFCEPAMERVCLLPEHVLKDLVSYALWLLECSHESGRCHAIMFFGASFPFPVILELFDAHDGLRKLINVISMLPVLTAEDLSHLSDDVVFGSRQSIRHASNAMRRYFEAHLARKVEQVRRSDMRQQGISLPASMPPYKAIQLSPLQVQQCTECLLETLPLRMRWSPVDHFLSLGGVQMLLQVINLATEWNPYPGRSESLVSILNTLAICAVLPKVQLQLCETFRQNEDEIGIVGMSILLGVAEGEVFNEPDVQRSALSVIVNCVCGPQARLGGSVGRIIGGSVKRRVAMRNGDDILSRMWNCVRSNNGIMKLISLLQVKTPITDADSIRALACKALAGVARSDKVKQIISKLPLFSMGQLQALMKEPVLQDKRQDHLRFREFAQQLIDRVVGKHFVTGTDMSLSKLNRLDVVAQTKITYNEKELLQLMYEHLLSKGLTESARTLQRECVLASRPHTSVLSPTPTALPSTGKLFKFANSPNRCLSFSGHRCTSTAAQSASSTSSTPTATSAPRSVTSAPSVAISDDVVPREQVGSPVRLSLTIHRPTVNPVSNAWPSASASASRLPPSYVTKSIIVPKDKQSPALKRHGLFNDWQDPPSTSVTLDGIVKEYLSEQHAHCKNPMVACPQFSLLHLHKCPEPRFRSSASVNISARATHRKVYPSYGGIGGASLDRKFLQSRFRPYKVFRDDEGSTFTCCLFSPENQFLALGTDTGELKLYNLKDATEAGSYVCHSSAVTNCEYSKDGKLLLTSSYWRRPLSALWSMGETFESLHTFDDDNFVQFSNYGDRIIGTRERTASVYDVTTGQTLNTLFTADSNNYSHNKACFNMSDDFVLNDGVLWDLRTTSMVHKFDKFNPSISGCFHPCGLEIIINSEIWDFRTFRLLHTQSGLDQCEIVFNTAADVIYGAISEVDMNELDSDKHRNAFGSSFRTFDATNYENIATIDVRRNIYDLRTDSSDLLLAVIESTADELGMSEESLCRLYEIGRTREQDEEQEEDDEENAEVEEDDDDDDDGDDDEELNLFEIGDLEVEETGDENEGDDNDGDDEAENEGAADAAAEPEESNENEGADGDGNDNEDEAEAEDEYEPVNDSESIESSNDADDDDDDDDDDFDDNLVFMLSDNSQ